MRGVAGNGKNRAKVTYPGSLLFMGEDWSMSKTLDRLQAEGKTKKIEALQELLNSCTEEQRAGFNRFYGQGEMVPEEYLDSAIKLVERTIRKNDG